MPYGYYQFVRLLGMSIFIYLGIDLNKSGRDNFSYIYFLLALLFQPFFKIALGRDLWNIIDITVAVFLLLSIIYKKEK